MQAAACAPGDKALHERQAHPTLGGCAELARAEFARGVATSVNPTTDGRLSV